MRNQAPHSLPLASLLLAVGAPLAHALGIYAGASGVQSRSSGMCTGATDSHAFALFQ